MGFSCGIVGLPNVGKSTLFNALTSAQVSAENYPFCTVDPNVGIVTVPDSRLEKIAAIVQPQKTTPTAIGFVDIAGLVRGASRGEGLGNQFLGHIREVDAVVHIVRCFEDPNVVHVEGSVDPARDIDTVATELCLADLDTATRAWEKAHSSAKSGDKELIARAELLQKIKEGLARGVPVRSISLKDAEKAVLRDFHFLTEKPTLYVCNVAEGTEGKANPHVDAVKSHAAAQGTGVVEISAKVEAEVAQLPPEERKLFLSEMGLSESGLDRVIHAGYRLLDLITFFTTTGKKECRAWTVRAGTKAPQAAGVIHTDFERGFIAAEICHYDDLIACGNETAARAKGLMRLEGRDYALRDGDIAHFRFNV